MDREQIIKAWEDEVAVGKEVGLRRDFINYVSISLVNATLSLIKELTEEKERLRAEKEAVNKESFYKWKKLADETADRYEGLYQDAKKSLVADTVKKMQEIIYERLDISVEGYSSEEIKSDVRDMVDRIAKEMLEGADDRKRD
jgi:gas vesicle protein